MAGSIEWFLIDCQEDMSYSLIPSEDVVYEGSIQKGDEVQFTYEDKEYVGCAVDFGGDDSFKALKVERDRLMKERKLQSKRQASFHGNDDVKRAAYLKGREFIHTFAKVQAKKPKDVDKVDNDEDSAETTCKDSAETTCTKYSGKTSSSDDSEQLDTFADKVERKKVYRKSKKDDFQFLQRASTRKVPAKDETQNLLEVEMFKGVSKGELNNEKMLNEETKKKSSKKTNGELKMANKDKNEVVEMSNKDTNGALKMANKDKNEVVEMSNKDTNGALKMSNKVTKRLTIDVLNKNKLKKVGQGASSSSQAENYPLDWSSDENAGDLQQEESGKRKNISKSEDDDTDEVLEEEEDKRKNESRKKRKHPSKVDEKRKKTEVIVFDGPMFRSSPQDPELNLTEIPGVLIKEEDLRLAKGCDCATTLTRTLFRVVFTRQALLSSSLGGNQAHRPSLDPTAVQLILKYVMDRQRKRGWRPPLTQGVVKTSLRSMLGELRRQQRNGQV